MMAAVSQRSSRQDRDRLSTDGMALTSNFITVKYGDNKEAIFNAWCTGQTLLHCIRKTCLCDKNDVLDLCDMEGNMSQLTTHQYHYATTFLDGRQTYILVKVERLEEDGPEVYNFLLDDIDILHPELADKIRRLQSTNQKPARKQNGRGWGTMRTMTRMGTRMGKSRDSSRKGSKS